MKFYSIDEFILKTLDYSPSSLLNILRTNVFEIITSFDRIIDRFIKYQFRNVNGKAYTVLQKLLRNGMYKCLHRNSVLTRISMNYGLLHMTSSCLCILCTTYRLFTQVLDAN